MNMYIYIQYNII